MDYSSLDPSQKYQVRTQLSKELHSEGISESREQEILSELRKLDRASHPKKKKLPKGYAAKGWNEDGTMDVLGGYVLDMKDHGKLIGHRRKDGTIIRRNPTDTWISVKAIKFNSSGSISMRVK